MCTWGSFLSSALQPQVLCLLGDGLAGSQFPPSFASTFSGLGRLSVRAPRSLSSANSSPHFSAPLGCGLCVWMGVSLYLWSCVPAGPLWGISIPLRPSLGLSVSQTLKSHFRPQGGRFSTSLTSFSLRALQGPGKGASNEFPGVIHLLLKMLHRTRVPAVSPELCRSILCTSLNGSCSLLGRASLSVLPGFLRASVSPTLLISLVFLVQIWSPPPATLAVPSRPGGGEVRAGARGPKLWVLGGVPVGDSGGGSREHPGTSAARGY